MLCEGDTYIYLQTGKYVDSCSQNYDAEDGVFIRTTDVTGSYNNSLSYDVDVEDHYDALVKEKAFAGNVPGGSVYALTDLERYFLYYDTLISVCKAGEASDDSSLAFGVFERNGDKLEKRYYSATKKPKKTKSLLIARIGRKDIKKSCNDIAAILGDETSEEVKAYGEYITIVDEEDEPEPQNDATSSRICFDNSGLLGWIVCPLVEAGSHIGNYLYDHIE